jgi:hypothetical protein
VLCLASSLGARSVAHLALSFYIFHRKETKEMVNSARISAVQMGQKFTWIHAKAETLRTLTDVTLTARFLAIARLRRQPGTAAKLWISQVFTRKALLEDPKLGTSIALPESLYLDILVGQMSAQETTVFDDCPSIGDDLHEKDWTGKNRYILDKLKRSIDACSNPPYFRGVKTRITDLLDFTEPKPAKEKRDQTKANNSKDKKDPPKPGDKSNNSHLARRPDHEQPAKLPPGLKRPDLDAVVDGHKIASEAQRQLFDDAKRGNCSRCHKGGHNRKDCKEPKAKWEDKFDKEKLQYRARKTRLNPAKWQQRAAAQKAPGQKDPPKPPTLHVSSAKPEQRFATLTDDSDSDDGHITPLVHFRMTMDQSDGDDDPTDSTPAVDGADDVDMTETAVHPAPNIPAILADVEQRLSTVTAETIARSRYPYPFADASTLLADPFFTNLLRDPEYSVIRFPNGTIVSCLTFDLDRARQA